MNAQELGFLIEMLADDLERTFIAALVKDKADKASRGAWADYLEETNRFLLAAAVRQGYTPGYGWYREGQGDIMSGVIGGGQISALYIASGAITSPFFGAS